MLAGVHFGPCLQHTQKSLRQKHLYHGVTSSFLRVTICNHLGTGDKGSDPETRPHSTFPPLFSPSVDELKRTLWCFCAAVTDVWLPPGVTEFQVAFLEPATNCVE